MRHYLVVANQTLGGEALLSQIREAMSLGACAFHLVVPATPVKDHLTYTEGEARALAEARLHDGLARLRAEGASVTGEVGDASPMQAIADAIRHQPFDEMILSTFPPSISRWVALDLPQRVKRRYDLPVTHVVTAPETSGT
jgi:GABA permease